ncbi:hypothetical protein BGW36DRAFT_422943 [Talaromyces proteolyticus]|uniref:Ecp2 effector protein domain-containing protein n=1 Tax=Talaromyces proteolyticus TaxID=1131652 RepID=A0AAD4L0R0_9EURO|nr:uncharacterized protein BGW36DRAFT_422943 [Talaromyces proteolyticus]KAH8703380.1 hypothetical protein BGW36DRAFT_422943 [Talaromyces proteolyticus]
MKNTWTLLSVLYLLTSSLPENALAHPTPAADIEIPQIIPHPDLPSLKSLGLTSAGLYGLSSANHTAHTAHQLQSRFQITCEDLDWPDGYAADNDRGDNGRANMLDAQACLNYLSKTGSAPCTVSFMYSAVIWCRAGTATVGGTHASGVTRTVISTWDVAIGGQEIIDQCNWPRGVAGANAANGNGGLIVKIEKFNETLKPIGPIHH